MSWRTREAPRSLDSWALPVADDTEVRCHLIRTADTVRASIPRPVAKTSVGTGAPTCNSFAGQLSLARIAVQARSAAFNSSSSTSSMIGVESSPSGTRIRQSCHTATAVPRTCRWRGSGSSDRAANRDITSLSRAATIESPFRAEELAVPLPYRGPPTERSSELGRVPADRHEPVVFVADADLVAARIQRAGRLVPP